MDKLGISYNDAGRISISSYKFAVDQNSNFWFTKDDDSASEEFDVLQIDKELIWKLDKFQNCLVFTKKFIQVEGTAYLIYLRRTNFNDKRSLLSLQEIVDYSTDDLQLKMCDIYLLLPGKIDTDNNVFSTFNEHSHELFSIFKESIDQSVNSEYSGSFYKKMDRKCLAEVTIKIKCLQDQNVYYQDALMCYVKHPSGFCILEIFVPCCAVGGNKLLNYYCGELLEIKFGESYYTIDALFKKLGLRRFGKKRSLVFSYGEITEQEKINALANEEFPMGQISGTHFLNLSRRNVAHYNTAQVFVSSETMMEVCSYINMFPEDRILYHVIEIFFVEMILFQDAAIDKVYFDLQQITDDLDINVDRAMKQSDEINYEMTQAIKFADYNCFLFPTVRESAKVIANAFGIELIYEKYERNKRLIDTFIKTNAQKRLEEQDRIKNRFLSLISALSIVGALGEIIHLFFEDATGSAYSYIGATIIVGIFYLLYLLLSKIKKK